MKQYLAVLALVAFAVTAGFVALLRLLLALTAGVPFYLGLLSLGIVCSGVVAGAALVLRRAASRQPSRDGSPMDVARTLERVVSATVLAGALNLCFFVVVPVTVDRSVSTFLLSRMPGRTSDRGMTKAQLEDVLVRGYVGETDAVGRRLGEQVVSGNVVETVPGEYKRTARAEAFLAFGRFVARVYGMETRFVEAP